jgi:putative oxidoreductase
MEPAHSIEPPSAVEFIPSQEHPSMPGPIPGRWSGYLLSLLRIVAAFLFIAHGTQKLFAWPIDEPRDAAQLLSLMGLAGVLETFGGTLLLLGWLTRPVAFLLAGEMAVAYFMSHLPRGFWPILNRGELPVLYCFLFLYLAAIGGGPWSIDAARSRRPGGD